MPRTPQPRVWARSNALFVVFGLLGSASAAPRAIADAPRGALDLPVAGLGLALAGALASWSVESAWGPDGGFDLVTIPTGRADTAGRYRVEVGGRTARDCPLGAPFPVELAGATWIRDGETFCLTLGEARVTVERLAPADETDETAFFGALARAVSERSLARLGPGPPESPVGGLAALEVSGLTLELPDDGLWRVAPHRPPRDFDALVRVVPAFPEVQVAVRRHAVGELGDCRALGRRLRSGTWEAPGRHVGIHGFEVVAHQDQLGFETLAYCRHRAGELLDVRVSGRPHVGWGAVGSLLGALGRTSAITPPPPSRLSQRDASQALYHWLTADTAASFDDGGDPMGLRGGVDLGLSWVWRNGPALTANLSVGADFDGFAWGASLEAGAAFHIASDLLLVLSLGWLERAEAFIENRALVTTVELRSGHLRSDGRMPWSLRVVAFQLASRVPRVTGAPLEIVWQGEVFPTFIWGFSWRSVADLPGITRPGFEIGLRLGWGGVWR